ncbi:MAG: 2-oxoacid:acceptor oxidoreductase subunit alpha, partial [Candidatus Bathyarchaeia archaeon]
MQCASFSVGPTVKASSQFCTGSDACVEGAITAGCSFFAGYPITPATEIAQRMATRMPQAGGSFIQMEDEIASICAIIGASWAGVKAMTATSGPGFSLMQEALGFAVMVETPCVVVDVQRIGPSSGGIFSQQGDVMQSRWGTHGNVHEIIALSPSSVQELYDVTVDAFNLSERYRVPVIVLTEEATVHTAENLRTPNTVHTVNRLKPTVPPDEFSPFDAPPDSVPPMPSLGDGYAVHYCSQLHDVKGYPKLSFEMYEDARKVHERLATKITLNIRNIARFDHRFLDDAEIIVFAYGFEARAATRAVVEARATGLKVGFLRPLTIWPFDHGTVQRLCSRARKVLVCEANTGQLVGEVERAVAERGKTEL